MSDEYLRRVEIFTRILEAKGWFLLISSIPFWYMTRFLPTTVVFVLMSIVWIVGAKMFRRRIKDLKNIVATEQSQQMR